MVLSFGHGFEFFTPRILTRNDTRFTPFENLCIHIFIDSVLSINYFRLIRTFICLTPKHTPRSLTRPYIQRGGVEKVLKLSKTLKRCFLVQNCRENTFLKCQDFCPPPLYMTLVRFFSICASLVFTPLKMH